MKKIFTLGLALMLGAMGAIAQNQRPTEQMMKEWRNTVQKRDISQRHLETNIPLAPTVTPKAKAMNALPEGRIWFPGEWEEVKAVVVTCYYSYAPATSQGSGYWMADPLVSGYADYFQYSAMAGWVKKGSGPYTATLDNQTAFGKTFFYLMDAIQLGGAQAWVRVERSADSNIVLNTLERMGLRHDNIRFIVGTGNSFWYRDCGPICFYSGDQDEVAMLDFTYYPGRALDDSLPSHIHHQMNIPNYLTDIEWEGGNCLVDGAGMLLSSDQIYSANNDRIGQVAWDGHNPNTIHYTQKTPLNKSQVRNAMQSLIGQRATHILPAFKYDGGTGHIDLYVDMWDENSFVFSQFPDIYSNWTDYKTASKNIDSLCSYKSIFDNNYGKTYIPFPQKDNGGNFASQNEYNANYTRTYSNHTFVNNVIMQPCFSAVVDGQPTASWDIENLQKIQAAYPGYTIYPIDVREFDGSGGAIHCITKQIPADSPIRILHRNVSGNISAAMENIPISAIVTNNKGISNVVCKYTINDGAENTITMTNNGNKYSCVIPTEGMAEDATVKYYIEATNTENKTITKPMTAHNGGYFQFTRTADMEIDYSQVDTNTTNVPMEDITFTFSSEWAHEDDSEPLNITTAEMEKQFGQFYPNPSNSQANIKIELGDGANYTVHIIDMSGRTIHTSSLQAMGSIVYTIDASKLAKGIYNVVFSGNNRTIARRLIVE